VARDFYRNVVTYRGAGRRWMRLTDALMKLVTQILALRRAKRILSLDEAGRPPEVLVEDLPIQAFIVWSDRPCRELLVIQKHP
jgi:hypothetical protein